MTPPSTSESSAMRNSGPRNRIAACIEKQPVIPSLRGISVLALRCLAALGMTLFAPAAHADEVVLDNASPGVQVSGPWVSTALTPGFDGADYLFRPGSGGDATVFWPFPSGSGGGRYEVYARWTSGPNRATT